MKDTSQASESSAKELLISQCYFSFDIYLLDNKTEARRWGGREGSEQPDDASDALFTRSASSP